MSSDPAGPPRVYLFHIPKTAGTSVGTWMRKSYKKDQRLEAYMPVQLIGRSREEINQFQYFQGHFGNTLWDILDEPLKVVTMLRDPVERFCSQIRFNRCFPRPLPFPLSPFEMEVIEIIDKHGADLERCLEEPAVRSICADFQTRYLADTVDMASFLDRPVAEYVEFMDSFQRLGPDDSMAKLPLAMKRLDAMTVVGIVERFEESAKLFSHYLALNPPDAWPKENSAPEKTNGEGNFKWNECALSEKARNMILEISQADLVLYQYANKLLQKKLDATKKSD